MLEGAMVAAGSAFAKLPQDKAFADLAGVEMMSLGLTADDMDRLFSLQNATIAAMLVSWSLPEAVPTRDTVDDLAPDVYEALAVATAQDAIAMIVPVNFDPNPDPESPTVPSTASDKRSRGIAKSASTEKSQTDGSSTVTDSSTPD
jgi:hypothetical protein